MTPHYQSWVVGKRRAAAQPNINGQEYASLRFPLPDRKLQEAFGNMAERLTTLHETQEVAAKNLDDLYGGLLQRAFCGDLTSKWREAHMKELLQEMEQQANVLHGCGWRGNIARENHESSH
jgi:type I restriction enzyme S subunit